MSMGPQVINLTVPEGANSGDTITFDVDNTLYTAEVPPGVSVGGVFQAQLPAAALKTKSKGKKKKGTCC
eukprot:NODE_7578_length_432_cov_192.872679.p4 GENE.NODE_7578_length_432_cov_192.872679~~NODE_7578_length_432_cov_192.872679.p4  ORF type:complete len:69 (-),score=20.74 NODE_7578_length_432_cov_192.872679:101-307(-)